MVRSDATDREVCWFLGCDESPGGELHGDNGFAVAACESHGIVGESYGWERFDPFDEEPANE